jgi:DNA-binding transcriptional ArsR family regulator
MPSTRLAPVVDLENLMHADESTDPIDDRDDRAQTRDSHVEAAEMFRLLGDPSRLAILHCLLDKDELCVCHLADMAGVGENVVSQAMRLLRAAEVVRTRRDGRRIYYRLADAHVRLLLDLSADRVRHREAAADAGLASR